MSLREANKKDKRRRILESARALFSSIGFAETTTRAIAAGAKVGVGTLFSYFSDKRQLLNAIFLDEIDRVADDAFAAIDPRAALIEQLMSVFGHLYAWFDNDRALSREIISQGMLQDPAGTVELTASTARYIANLAILIRRAAGDRADEIPEMVVATSLFANYHVTLVTLLTGHLPDRTSALRVLRTLVEWNLRGLERRA